MEPIGTWGRISNGTICCCSSPAVTQPYQSWFFCLARSKKADSYPFNPNAFSKNCFKTGQAMVNSRVKSKSFGSPLIKNIKYFLCSGNDMSNLSTLPYFIKRRKLCLFTSQ